MQQCNPGFVQAEVYGDEEVRVQQTRYQEACTCDLAPTALALYS